MLNPFELIKIYLEKSKLPLNLFGSAYPDQNSTNIEKVENNKATKNSKLIFCIDYYIGIQRFCISPNVATEVITVAHKNGHTDFAKYYKIVTRL